MLSAVSDSFLFVDTISSFSSVEDEMKKSNNFFNIFYFFTMYSRLHILRVPGLKAVSGPNYIFDCCANIN